MDRKYLITKNVWRGSDKANFKASFTEMRSDNDLSWNQSSDPYFFSIYNLKNYKKKRFIHMLLVDEYFYISERNL